jgi:hypothetical protein
MSFITQVLATLGWIVVAPLAISLIVWLILQPYFKGWSRAERRAADLLRDTLTPEQFRQLVWRGYLEIPSPTEPQRVYRVPRTMAERSCAFVYNQLNVCPTQMSLYFISL